MANKLHKDLASDERHLPIGFESGQTESALIKDENGELEYRSLSLLGATGPEGPQGPEGGAIENVIVVQKNPSDEQFATITAALASITDNSATNRYLILIGPGTYTEDTLTMKPHVFLVGHERATIIEPDDVNKDVIVAVDDASISNLVLRGATGTGAALISMSTSAVGSEFNAENIIFRSGYHFVKMDSTGGQSKIILKDCSPGFASEPTKPFVIEGTGTGQLRVNNFVWTNSNSNVAIDDFVFATGANNSVNLIDFIIILDQGSGSNGVRANTGSTLFLDNVHFEGFDTSLFSENVGAGPRIVSTGFIALASTNFDINIVNPNTTGGINGTATESKISIDPNANLSLSLVDPDPSVSNGLLVLGDIIQADRFDRTLNLSKLGRSASTMGRFEGGELSDDGGLNVRVAAGNGFLIEPSDNFVKEIFWNEVVLTINSQSSVYIFVDTDSVVSQSTSLPSLSKTIILGLVSTLDTTIHFIQRVQMNIAQFGNRVSAFQREAFGPVFSQGSIVSENSITARELDVTGGDYWFGVNQFQPTGGSSIQFDQFSREAISGFNIVSGVTVVTNSEWDDGSGTLASLDTSKFAKHSLYLLGEGSDEAYFLVISQQQFDTLVEAESGDIPTPPTSFKDAVVLIASIIVQQGQTNLISILDNRPVLGFKAPGVSASAVHGNLLGLTQDDHPQYLLEDGSRSLSGNLNIGGNNIVSVGTVDGVQVSNHSARHNPGGADSLSTASAVELTDSTNAEGNATSFARSNHTHAHGDRSGGTLHSVVTTSVNGFMSAVDKVILDRLRTGYLQYTNSLEQTNSTTTLQSIVLDTNRSSFPNSFFTKVNGTDFRADFTGSVKISYSVYIFPANNDRGSKIQLFKNGSALSGTERNSTGLQEPLRGNTASLTWIEDVVPNDIITLRFNSEEASVITIDPDRASLLVEIQRVGTT